MRKSKFYGLPFITHIDLKGITNDEVLILSTKKLLKDFVKFLKKTFRNYSNLNTNELYNHFKEYLLELNLSINDVHIFESQHFECNNYGGELEHLPYQLLKNSETGEITLGEHLNVWRIQETSACGEKETLTIYNALPEIACFRVPHTIEPDYSLAKEWFFVKVKEKVGERSFWQKVVQDNMSEISTWDF